MCVCLCVLGQRAKLILNLAINGGGWSALRHGRFYPLERAAGTHCIGVWGASQSVWTFSVTGNLLAVPGIEPRIVHPVA